MLSLDLRSRLHAELDVLFSSFLAKSASDAGMFLIAERSLILNTS